MFDGVAEQFHQFIASRASPSPLPLPPSSAFPFHGFDPFPNPSPSPPPPPPHQQHQFLQHPSVLVHHKDVQEEEEKDRSLIAMSMNFNIDAQADRSIPGTRDHSPWSNEEVVALLRIGTSMENWFPEVTWEHVSRKLAEIGFKRSAEKCKEKFEEQTRSFNNKNSINVSSSKNNNYMLLVSELEGLYDHHQLRNHGTPPQQQLHEVPHNINNDDDDGNIEKTVDEEDKEEEEVGKPSGEVGENNIGQNNMEEINSGAVETAELADNQKRLLEEEVEDNKFAKKRKRREKFEMFKRFCENTVERLMAQQEEMHNKFLEDMMKRDREMVEREQAWKKMEMERTDKELDIMAHEQTISHNRQATIIELWKRFTSPSRGGEGDDDDSSPNPGPASRLDMVNEFRMSPVTGGPVDDDNLNPSPPQTTVSPIPNSLKTAQNLRISNTDGSDTGKRWPREEVLALINLRCTIQGNSEDGDHQHPQGATKAPLWERIAQGMSELGYRRSAKRCKEKWENINKYFRKTKDRNASKKRSLDSRACPYFHQLSTLYNQGKLEATMPPSKRPSSQENCLSPQETR